MILFLPTSGIGTIQNQRPPWSGVIAGVEEGRGFIANERSIRNDGASQQTRMGILVVQNIAAPLLVLDASALYRILRHFLVYSDGWIAARIQGVQV